ncbi:GDP-mannose 4,6-dehydratase [Hydrogenimonas thermophila]|uniref:GDP-mannose 4,6-dehydratase n=1 Tax=Hydrogenimonas thermophila TaxID=223786 RepID=UPI002936E70E|nr:GDP-mannose 4,6-dehydratase [Hydrogenimonas thermophila]WOE69448.1 GDP-mannose 4,6-dehydratase [Hydrogenimonas thermophila]WOE71958.1 GDP-mannose 4,6-dehydratase [Hydrogenimonas thermophila]
MKSAIHSKKVLITGINGFTGRHLEKKLLSEGFEVYGTVLQNPSSPQHYRCDITNQNEVDHVIKNVKPDYIIHTAAISFVGEQDSEKIYQVNVIGTENILKSLLKNKVNPQKIIIVSSATVYGNQGTEVLDESMCINPVNHYGCSKSAMEYITKNYFDKLNIAIVRPFNYTGIGHAEHFLIPKIVKAYQMNKKEIELGNLDVAREFNDIRDVVNIYYALMINDFKSDVVNICSGRAIPLMEIINLMNEIAGYSIKVSINPAFVRKNEIKRLSGDEKKILSITNYKFKYKIRDTLEWMYKHYK